MVCDRCLRSLPAQRVFAMFVWWKYLEADRGRQRIDVKEAHSIRQRILDQHAPGISDDQLGRGAPIIGGQSATGSMVGPTRAFIIPTARQAYKSLRAQHLTDGRGD